MMTSSVATASDDLDVRVRANWPDWVKTNEELIQHLLEPLKYRYVIGTALATEIGQASVTVLPDAAAVVSVKNILRRLKPVDAIIIIDPVNRLVTFDTRANVESMW